MRGYNYGNTMLTSFVCEMSIDSFVLLEKMYLFNKSCFTADSTIQRNK